MDYFLSGGQAVAGLATLVLWWLTLSFIGRRGGHKLLSSMGFALWPSLIPALVGWRVHPDPARHRRNLIKGMDHETYSVLLGTIAYLFLWVALIVLVWLGRK